ncbi:ExbD/TolR family protein [Aeromonas sp. 80P]
MLIFFIVTTSFVREAGLEVHRPRPARPRRRSPPASCWRSAPRGRSSSTASRSTWSGCRPASPACWRSSPDASLVIQADERVPHGKVVRVMDEAKAAGIANIAVAVAPK